jgi:dihydroflavonol-4-reductase
MSIEGANRTVLVTGGSGFIGNWMIAALLQRGYSVRTTVRNLSREASVRAAIAKQTHAGERLSFFAADLLGDAGWDAAVEGCDFIMHVASPMPVGEFKGTDVIRPAREGTLRVLKAGIRAGVRRVVITSSLQAALPPATYAGGPTDETVWTDLSGKALNDYTRAKTLAEQDAWAFMQQQPGSMALTTILPGMVQGPVLGPDYSGSVELITRMLTGKIPRFPRIGFSLIDVRDLVDLHIRAMESASAAGQRYIGTADFLWFSEVARILRENFGERAAKVPTRALPDFVVRLLGCVSSDMRFFAQMLGKRREFTTQKAATMLGWQARPAADAIADTAMSLIRQGLVETPRPATESSFLADH